MTLTKTMARQLMLELVAAACDSLNFKVWIPHLFLPTLKVVGKLFDALMWHLPEVSLWKVKGRKQVLKTTNKALEPKFPFTNETTLS